MITNCSPSLRISTTRQADKLTPAQKKFNTLIKRLDRQRKRLAEWQEIMPFYQEEVINTFQPLRDSYACLWRISIFNLKTITWTDLP
jgi:membrane protein insertase Oxa1/YidC/SpoIIIJ